MESTEVTLPERRMHPRTQIAMSVQALRMDPGGVDMVDQLRMVDISRGGLGAVSDRAYYPGQRLMLKLPARDMGIRSLCATIRRCVRQAGKYHLGIEFDHPVGTLWADTYSAGAAAVAA